LVEAGIETGRVPFCAQLPAFSGPSARFMVPGGCTALPCSATPDAAFSAEIPSVPVARAVLGAGEGRRLRVPHV